MSSSCVCLSVCLSVLRYFFKCQYMYLTNFFKFLTNIPDNFESGLINNYPLATIVPTWIILPRNTKSRYLFKQNNIICICSSFASHQYSGHMIRKWSMNYKCRFSFRPIDSEICSNLGHMDYYHNIQLNIYLFKGTPWDKNFQFCQI